jgi:hypothetical protein
MHTFPFATFYSHLSIHTFLFAPFDSHLVVRTLPFAPFKCILPFAPLYSHLAIGTFFSLLSIRTFFFRTLPFAPFQSHCLVGCVGFDAYVLQFYISTRSAPTQNYFRYIVAVTAHLAEGAIHEAALDRKRRLGNVYQTVRGIKLQMDPASSPICGPSLPA